MSDRRLVVVEANEIPPRVFQWYADLAPRSTVARLVRTGGLRSTVNQDELGERELYPSQTWATLATGCSYAEHQVYWYGDPKPVAMPTYWQVAAAQGKRVGVVGTLHSSPFAVQCADPNIVFAIPDCFATDGDTRPEKYRRLQELNLHMTRANGRTASGRPRSADALTMATSMRLGVRPATLAWLTRLLAEVASGRVSRERLRCAQFALFSDVFLRLCKEHDPDLAVVFTNHVAANMHRYWYATFPDDWADARYDDDWIERYRDEIPHAMRLLDRVLAALMTYCDATDRDLIVVSSMGMVAETELDTSRTTAVTVRDPARFVAALGIREEHVVKTAMVPQIQLEFPSAGAAITVAGSLSAHAHEGLRVRTQIADTVLTLSYEVDPGAGAISIDGRRVSFADAGLEAHTIDDHRSGNHHPVGTMIDSAGRIQDDSFDVRMVAPAILERLGVEVPSYMQKPVLQN